jgi:HPt (histidine-containing phosphotransfer) domain-containing protein
VDEFIEIGASAADSMFATFLVETERRLAILRGLCCDDRAAIAFEAHTLTGSGGTFGMMRLSWLARELERKSATIAPGAYPAAVQQLLEVYGGARHELLAYLDTVASPRAGSEN